MTIKIEAAQRLKTYAGQIKKLMARVTPVTRVAEKGYTELSRLMLRKGYKVDRKESKAVFEAVFYKTEMDGDHKVHREFEITGWHGTSGRYGPEKTVFELYDKQKGDKPVVTIGVINEENINEIKQKETIDKMMAYLERNA